MMAQDQVESIWEPINHRRFINLFLPDIIKIDAATRKDKYKNVYTFITIVDRSTLARSGSTW